MWGATSLSIVPPGVAAARWSGFRYIGEGETERELWVVRSVFRDCVSVPIAFGLRTTCITSLILPPLLRWQISTQSLAPCTNGGLASLAMIVPTFFCGCWQNVPSLLYHERSNVQRFSRSLCITALKTWQEADGDRRLRELEGRGQFEPLSLPPLFPSSSLSFPTTHTLPFSPKRLPALDLFLWKNPWIFFFYFAQTLKGFL